MVRRCSHLLTWLAACRSGDADVVARTVFVAGMFAFGNGKFEEAAELYGQAAKQYQLGKNCESRRPLRARRGSLRGLKRDSSR